MRADASDAGAPDASPPRLLLLLGMKHCGKTTVGRSLAEAWGWAFHDVDELTEQAHAARTNRHETFREIYRNHGAEHFARMEAEGVASFLDARQGQVPAVLALGGATILNEAIAPRLSGAGLCVYLRVDCDELWRRVQQTGLPAFLDPDCPEASFRQRVHRRSPRYESFSDVTVDLTGLDPPAAAEAVRRRVEPILFPKRAI